MAGVTAVRSHAVEIRLLPADRTKIPSWVFTSGMCAIAKLGQQPNASRLCTTVFDHNQTNDWASQAKVHEPVHVMFLSKFRGYAEIEERNDR